MNASLGMDLIRSFFAGIDKFIYMFISKLFDLLIKLTEQSVFSNETIDEVSRRVYTFLGVIMLFKVTFSLISYIVNPDSITDKNTGASNIVKNVIVTLFMIIIVPYGFDFLYQAQRAIIKDNIIAGIILGTTGDTAGAYLTGTEMVIDRKACKNEDGSYIYTKINSNGDFMAMTTFRPFYQIYPGKDISEVNGYCTEGTVGDLLKDTYYNAEDSVLNTGEYIIDYSNVLSTAAGVVVMLLLLSFCMDIALRVIKLGFLEVIAPIPIISYVDPKSGKDGMFKKWLKEVGKTWTSLFVRLAVLYFAIYSIQLVNDALANSEDNDSIWIMLFLTIGALMFAKQAPKLLEDIFGIKFDGMALNPIKKLQNETTGLGIATGVGAGAVATVGGVAANTWANVVNNKAVAKKLKDQGIDKNKDLAKYRHEFFKNGGRGVLGFAGSAVAGGASAGLRTFVDSAKAGNKVNPFKSIDKGISDSSTARTRRNIGYGIKAGIIDKATDMAHIPQSYGTTSTLKNEKKSYEREINDLTSRREALLDQYRNIMPEGKTLSFQEATKRIYEKDKKRLDKPEYVYTSYEDYHKEHFGENDLTETEFNNIRNLEVAIDNIEKDIAAAKKNASKIEENMKKDK